MKSPNEYRQCLLSYIRFLEREADESYLREVCESFLGPPTGIAEAASLDLKNPTWDPCVLVRLFVLFFLFAFCKAFTYFLHNRIIIFLRIHFKNLCEGFCCHDIAHSRSSFNPFSFLLFLSSFY